MKTIVLDSFRTRGFVHFDSTVAIPSRRGSIAETSYLVGYYNNEKFVVCYETEQKDNVKSLLDLFYKERPIYHPVVIQVTSKVCRL